MDISGTTDTTAVMAFSVYLSKIDTIKGSPRFWLLDNTTNTAGDSTARDVLAVITSEISEMKQMDININLVREI